MKIIENPKRRRMLIIQPVTVTKFINGDVSTYSQEELIGWNIIQTSNLESPFYIPLESIEYDYDSLGIESAAKCLYDFVTIFNGQLISDGTIRKTDIENFSKIRLIFGEEITNNLFAHIEF